MLPINNVTSHLLLIFFCCVLAQNGSAVEVLLAVSTQLLGYTVPQTDRSVYVDAIHIRQCQQLLT